MKKQDILQQIRDLQAHMASVREQRQDGLFATLAERFLALTDDRSFSGMGRPTDDPLVRGLLTRIVGGLCGKATPLSGLLMIGIQEARFLHGCAMAGEWMVMFFWFPEPAEGLAVFSRRGGDNRLFRISRVDAEGRPGAGVGAAIPGEH